MITAVHPDKESRQPRPYAATGGRIQAPGEDLQWDTHVLAQPVEGGGPLTVQERHLLGLCRTPRAVAEVASVMGMPCGVVTVLIADLRARGQVATRAPFDMAADTRVTHALMERIVGRLRSSLADDQDQEGQMSHG